MSLKERLIQIRENDYNPEGHNLDSLCEELLEHIGSTDPELRDSLIYTTFANWVLNDRIDPLTLKKMLLISLDENHLFHCIGESGTDSVFSRAFSVLIVALVIYADRKDAFLSETEFHYVKERVTDYFIREQDRRGYVEAKGWAHAIAHAADTIDELARHRLADASDLSKWLQVIRTKVVWEEGVYCHNEDERLALPALAILQNEKLPANEGRRWIESFEQEIANLTNKQNSLQKMYTEINIKHFLSSLYFQLEDEELRVGINKILRK